MLREPVLALVVGKNGMKLPEAAPDADAPEPEPPGGRTLYSPQGDARVLDNGTLVVTGGTFGPIRGGRGSTGGMKFQFLKLTMPALAELLMPHVDRPVVDMTNLKGSYYLVSENHPPTGGPGRKGGGPAEAGRAGGDGADSGPTADPFGEGLFAALEKGGLKLEGRKAPVETIVVDRLEKTPTGN